MSLIATEVTGPSHFASAAINDDYSGMTDKEIEAFRRWSALITGSIVSIVENSERFTWHYRLHGGDYEGGEVCDYVVLIEGK